MTTINPLTYGQIVAMIPEVDQDGLDLMEVTRTLVEFEGYDPFVIRALLDQRAKAATADINEDVLKMVVISIERRNNFDNMMKSMSEDAGRNLVNTLKNRYQLVSKIGINKKRSVTMSRVEMSVPWISCPSMEFVSPAISWQEMKNLSPNYPFTLIHPSFAATIPNSLT